MLTQLPFELSLPREHQIAAAISLVPKSCTAWIHILVLGLLLLVMTGNAGAAQVTLTWDANTEPQLAGYKVYYGQSRGNYTGSVDVGNQTSYTLTNLAAGQTYYFAVTAYGPSGQEESDLSGEIQATIPAAIPVANFSASPTTGNTAATFVFTDDSAGNVTAWNWNFGDGSKSSSKVASHTYANPGVYSVSLTVTGAGGSNQLTKPNYITVTPPAPMANFTANPTSGKGTARVAFSHSATGNISAWDWNFGDGTTSKSKNPLHIYAAPGVYSVSLTVTGPGGSNTLTKSNYITVAVPEPVASFTSARTTGKGAVKVTFSDTSSGSITGWQWNFGDGVTSNIKNPMHIYAAPGAYSVSLTVTGPGGSNTVINYITVGTHRFAGVRW